jgi:hypothetical protein
MSEILLRLYEGLVKTNLPEVLNACPLLDELRYLVLLAVAPASPFGLAKTEFNRSDLRKIAKALRLRFEYYHEAPEMLENRLAKFNLIVANERESRLYYSITKEGGDEVVKRMELLGDLVEVTKLEQKFLTPGHSIKEKTVLPKSVVQLASDSPSIDDLLAVEEDMIKGLVLRP